MNWELFSFFTLGYFLLSGSVYFFLFIISFISIVRYHLRARFATPREILKAKITPPISLLLPAHNEGKTIVDSVRSAMTLAYPEYEIIVINDGSRDDTMAVMEKEFNLRRTSRIYHQTISTKPVRGIYRSESCRNLVVVDKEQGGKADALNVGINISAFPLFCSMDADSLLDESALLRVVHPFLEAYKQTIGVGGIVRPVNGCVVEHGRVRSVFLSKKWLVNFQNVEYLRAFLSGRMGWSLINSLLIISGAFGIFKKQPVIATGGYRTDIVGEDMELVVRLRRALAIKEPGSRFHFIPDPVCWTEVPENLRVLARQRNRWQRGLAESLWIHISMLFNPSYGALGCMAMPYFVFLECLSPIVEMGGLILFFAAFISGSLSWHHCYVFLCLTSFLGVLFSLLAILMEEVTLEQYTRRRELARLIAAAILENFGYRQVLSFVRAKGLLDFFLGHKSWGEMERTGMKTFKAGS